MPRPLSLPRPRSGCDKICAAVWWILIQRLSSRNRRLQESSAKAKSPNPSTMTSIILFVVDVTSSKSNTPFKSRSNYKCGPAFFTRLRPHSMGETRFLVVLLKNHLKKRFGVATYFCFILKGKNKIIKKNPKCDS